MGTTGGDRELLYKTVDDSKVYAVISPQMGKQVLESLVFIFNFFSWLTMRSSILLYFKCMTVSLLILLGCSISCSNGDYGETISWRIFGV